MADGTGIEWTDATWNPVRGCSKVSAGCTHCYAETVAARFSGPGQPYAGLVTGGRWNGNVHLVVKHLEDPLRWKKPRRIFVNSMSDLFHENLSDQAIAEVFAVMAVAKDHAFQVLTKRPKRMRDLLRSLAFRVRVDACMAARGAPRGWCAIEVDHWPLPNVWLGVSVEDQKAANVRIPLLIQTPAAVRFLSCEPLLGPVNLDPLLCQNCGGDEVHTGPDGTPWCPMCDEEEMGTSGWLDPDGIGWVIVGGESGHGARPMHPAWVRSLRDQCTSNEVPFFFKQWGEWRSRESQDGDDQPRLRLTDAGDNGSVLGAAGGEDVWMQRVGKKVAGRALDGRTWDEFPESVRA